jgi:hypothetical protein
MSRCGAVLLIAKLAMLGAINADSFVETRTGIVVHTQSGRICIQDLQEGGARTYPVGEKCRIVYDELPAHLDEIGSGSMATLTLGRFGPPSVKRIEAYSTSGETAP